MVGELVSNLSAALIVRLAFASEAVVSSLP